MLTGHRFHDALNAYVECAIWSSTHRASEDADPVEMDSLDAELAPETRQAMSDELEAFVSDEETAALLDGMDPEQVGHDFWLTRNHHGAGFWDRGLGERGEALTRAAHAYGSVDLYLGDDGRIYQS